MSSPFFSWWVWLRVDQFFYLLKDQLLALLIFAIVFFVSISFISPLIFMISFLLLALGFLCYSFSSCFKCRVRFLIWDFSCFLRWDWIAINCPHRTAFAASHRFSVIVFSFSFVSVYFFISSLISSVICWLLSNALFSLHVFVFLIVFFTSSLYVMC